MRINDLLTDLNKLQKDSKELQEIRTILGNDDTITLVEQDQHLQDNTTPNNINNIRKKLGKLQTIVDDIGSSFSHQYDEVASALSSLENVSDECDECYDASTKIDELFGILEAEEQEQEETPVETTPTDDTDNHTTTTQQ